MENICIRPLGEVSDEMLQYLTNELSLIFDRDVISLSSILIPSQSYDVKRRQYLSTELLKILLSTSPLDAYKTLGITEVDIFIPIFTYVFGEAQLGGRAALISLARLRPQHYEELPDEELYKMRILKEAVHELGHTFGLTHCVEPKCVMRFANNIVEVDDKGSHFCPNCAYLIMVKKNPNHEGTKTLKENTNHPQGDPVRSDEYGE
ncbi:MAG: archaemetzincin family Zn-dependent metalloprotease [Planctomycetota bacterium]